MELIRKYCFGEGNISMSIVSDQAKNFPNFKTVNYEDPNFNISVPMFIIHGNHDDPAGVWKPFCELSAPFSNVPILHGIILIN
jgi:DNA repair exonuclease SbcCD nuclease subunit